MSKTTMFKRLGLGLTLVVLSLALVACGGKDENKEDPKVAVTGASLMAFSTEANVSKAPVYSMIAVKGLMGADATTAAVVADYAEGGDSSTVIPMALEPANNDGAVTFLVTDTAGSTTASTLVAAKSSGGNLVVSFLGGGAIDDLAKVEGKEFFVTASNGKEGDDAETYFTVSVKPVAYATDVDTVAKFEVDGGDADAAKATVEKVMLDDVSPATDPVTYKEGSTAQAVTLTGAGADKGVKVELVEGDGFTPQLFLASDDTLWFKAFTSEIGKSATFKLTTVGKKGTGDAAAEVVQFVKVASEAASAQPATASVADASMKIETTADSLTSYAITKGGGTAPSGATIVATVAAKTGTTAVATVPSVTFSDGTDAKTDYADITTAIVKTETALKAGDTYVVTLKVMDGTTEVSNSTFEVTASAYDATATIDAATNIFLTKGATATLAITSADNKYTSADYDLLTVVTDGSSATTDLTAVATEGDGTTKGSLLITTTKALTAGDTYTVTLHVVKQGETDVTNSLSNDAVVVTVLAVPTLTAPSGTALTTSAVSGSASTLDVTFADYNPALYDVLATQKTASDSTGNGALSLMSVVDTDTTNSKLVVTYTLTNAASGTDADKATMVLTIVPKDSTDVDDAIGTPIEFKLTSKT